MTIIGFNFTKINAEKGSPAKGQIKINRNCHPTNVEEVKIGTGQKALKYTFVFGVEYTPKVAKMDFTGTITELVDEKQAEAILSGWKDKQKIPPKELERIMNAILNRCHVEALLMAKELNIPAPFQLPQIRVQEKKAEKPKDKKPAKKK